MNAFDFPDTAVAFLPDTMLVSSLDVQSVAGPTASQVWVAVMAVLCIVLLAVAMRLRFAPAMPRWGGWFPEVHPEDRAFCHHCGGHFTPGAMYDAHMKACR